MTMSPAPGIGRNLVTSPLAAARMASLLLVAAVLASHAPAAHAQAATAVRVERIKPKKPKHETLRFLKENRDFIRARFDLLRVEPSDRREVAEAIDPEYLAYPQMLAKIMSAKDSVAFADDSLKRKDLLASIADLSKLEKQLDLMDQLLADQRGRLGILQDNFTGHQHTALVVVVSGDPTDVDVSEVSVTIEDGSKVTVPLGIEERESLKRGGIVQVFHGFVEPREQVVEVTITGTPWPSGDAGYVTLDPTRDRLTFLRLDLSAVRSARGAAGIQASTWLHDTRPNPGDG
jgi:hypothetical protein